MLDAFPIYHWFHNGNPYSGAEGGMRYVITPGKKADPNDESGKKKLEYLTAQIWPGPWSIEHTAEEKIESAEFDGSQAGLDAALPERDGPLGKYPLHSGLRAGPVKCRQLIISGQGGTFCYKGCCFFYGYLS